MSGAAKIPPTVAHSLSERDFQRQVVELARRVGFSVYHTHDSRRSEPGFPDLLCARAGRLLVAELKTEKGRLTGSQRAWLQTLEQAGVETHVWRPSMWPEIVEVLTYRHGAAAT